MRDLVGVRSEDVSRTPTRKDCVELAAELNWHRDIAAG